MSTRDAIRMLSVWALALLIALGTLSGCRSLALPGFGESELEKQRARELHALLERYTRDFASTIEQSADEIVDSTTDLKIGRATVQWKLRAIPRVRELSRTETQGEALLGLWLYTEAMAYDLENGRGKELFGEAQPIAVAACRQLSEKMASLARQVILQEENFLEAQTVIQDYVERYVARQPEGGPQGFTSVEAAIIELAGRAGALGWMPTFSLRAFNPFGGLNETAAALREFTEQTGVLVENLSSELPWQLELLLYDVEGRDTVREAQASLERVSESAASLAQTAADWPADVEGVVATTLDQIDARQDELRLTLDRAEGALADAKTLVAGLNDTAANLTDAGEAWDVTFRTLGLGDEPSERLETGASSEEARRGPSERSEAGRPFEILDYRSTAEELRRVAIELRALVADVQALTSEGGEDTPLGNIELAAQTAVAAAAGEGRELVDHIALRLVQLVGVIFLAAIVYRVLSSRIAKRPSTGA